MLTLRSEAKFWTSSASSLSIKATDFGAFRYHTKRESAPAGDDHQQEHATDYLSAKRDYAVQRAHLWQLANKRPQKLRESLARLDDALRHNRIVHCKWQDHAVVQLLLSHGLLVHVCVNQSTGDIQRLAFDKYLVGKLPADTITDAVFTRMHILLAFPVNQITFVHLQKPSMRRSAPEKLARMDPKIFNVLINGPPNRSLARQLTCNASGDLVAVWTKSSQNEVYPWRPTVRDQDRANVNIYRLFRAQLEPICFYWTENDPISIEFSAIHQNQLHSVEQNVSRKGQVTADICTYEMRKAKLHRISVTAIPLQTQICCHSFSADNEKLLLGCIDGTIVVFDESRGITHLVRAAFIPTMVSWHADSAIVAVANDRGQLQCFDISLACIRNQLQHSDDTSPATVLDLSTYFIAQPHLTHILWNKKPDLALHTEPFSHSDGHLLLLFQHGPAVCLRFIASAGLKGDVHASGLTADVLVHQYLHLAQVERAINVLLCMNWDTNGPSCMVALHKIASYIFRLPLVAEREVQLQKALGSFHVPVKALCDETEADFGDQVRDITRKFFQYLLRFRSFEKAFSLAIDINDEDLFMDLHNCAKAEGQVELAVDAFNKAKEILADIQADVNSDCSRSSCSECEPQSSPEPPESPPPAEYVNLKRTPTPHLAHSRPSSQQPSQPHYPPLPTIFQQARPKKSWAQEINNAPYVPPLPFAASDRGSEHIRVNLPKLELKVSAYSKNHSDRSQSAGRHRLRTAATYSAANLTADNILLVDPPLPTLIRKTSSQDNLIHIDVVPHPTHRLYHNSFSTENLNHTVSGASYPNLDKIPRALPRIHMNPSSMPIQQKHMVIEVVPKPSTHIKPIVPAGWKVPDQTLGIPITNPIPLHHHIHHHNNHNNNHFHQPQYVHRPPPPSAFAHPSEPSTISSSSHFAPKSPSAPSVIPIIHQHPITQANIPASSHHHHAPQTHQPATTNKRLNQSTTGAPMATNSILSQAHQPSPKRDPHAEKNKVKFSDTVTVALVPEIARKPIPLGGGGAKQRTSNGFLRLTDPQRELADSLPLCHPNDDYLKDFTPISSSALTGGGHDEPAANGNGAIGSDRNANHHGANNHNKSSATGGGGGALKVVHFGII